MRIPAWRLALTGAAIVSLAIAGIGLASAAGVPASQAPGGAATAPGAAPDLDPAAGAGGARARALRPLRHVVHGVVTFQDKDGALVTIQLDRGIVTAVDGDSVTVSEAGGASVTVALDDATKVRVGRAKGNLADITVGDDLLVQSRLTDGSALARHIVIVPAS